MTIGSPRYRFRRLPCPVLLPNPKDNIRNGLRTKGGRNEKPVQAGAWTGIGLKLQMATLC